MLEGLANGIYWYILRPFDIVCGNLVYFMPIWYIFLHLGMLNQEKSGNPGLNTAGLGFFGLGAYLVKSASGSVLLRNMCVK
jgi:hypothetical protein